MCIFLPLFILSKVVDLKQGQVAAGHDFSKQEERRSLCHLEDLRGRLGGWTPGDLELLSRLVPNRADPLQGVRVLCRAQDLICSENCTR